MFSLRRIFFHATLKKKPPSQLDEVKQWAIKEKNATEDGISTRDQQPYGVVLRPMGNQVIVYEQTGQNGKCYMIVQGQVTEQPKEDMDKLIEGFKSVRMGPGRGAGK